jgi:hypothetical protein
LLSFLSFFLPAVYDELSLGIAGHKHNQESGARIQMVGIRFIRHLLLSLFRGF